MLYDRTKTSFAIALSANAITKSNEMLTVKHYKSGVIYTGTRSVSPSLRKSLVYSK